MVTCLPNAVTTSARHCRPEVHRKEPRIPGSYLASDTEGYEENDYGIPEYDRRILQVQAAYVDRFVPGKLIRVSAPHFMEPVIPEMIAEEVREVTAASS